LFPDTAFSITMQGSKTGLGAVTGYFSGSLIGGADNRFYTAVEMQDNPGSVVSFCSAAGSKRTFPRQDLIDRRVCDIKGRARQDRDARPSSQ
jgi:hypothetical protein